MADAFSETTASAAGTITSILGCILSSVVRVVGPRHLDEAGTEERDRETVVKTSIQKIREFFETVCVRAEKDNSCAIGMGFPVHVPSLDAVQPFGELRPSRAGPMASLPNQLEGGGPRPLFSVR